MSTLVSFPGRNGDLIWSLPCIRALSRRLGEPIDLQIAGEFTPLVPLLAMQPYLGGVYADPKWNMSMDWQAPAIEMWHDRVFHLGYRRWPEFALPLEAAYAFNLQHGEPVMTREELCLEEPWITNVPPASSWRPWLCAFTEAHFELKFGIWKLLQNAFMGGRAMLSISTGPRWQTEAHHMGCSWMDGAAYVAGAPFILADCSAWHVLACAIGTPVLMMEPMEARHNPIFYPFGMNGPQVTMIRGNDGLPTFDARHCADAIRERLHAETS